MKEAVTEEMNEYRERITTLEGQVFDLSEENEKFQGEIHDLHCKGDQMALLYTTLRDQVHILQSEAKILSAELEDLRQYSRRNCILVYGVCLTV